MNDQPVNGENGNPLDGLRNWVFALRPGTWKDDSRLLPAIYIVIFVILSVLLFPPTKKTREVAFAEGEIADVDVIAPLDIAVPLSGQEFAPRRGARRSRLLRDRSVFPIGGVFGCLRVQFFFSGHL